MSLRHPVRLHSCSSEAEECFQKNLRICLSYECSKHSCCSSEESIIVKYIIGFSEEQQSLACSSEESVMIKRIFGFSHNKVSTSRIDKIICLFCKRAL